MWKCIKKYQNLVGWKGEEDYGATLLRGIVLFALKTAVVGLRHITCTEENNVTLCNVMSHVTLVERDYCWMSKHRNNEIIAQCQMT